MSQAGGFKTMLRSVSSTGLIRAVQSSLSTKSHAVRVPTIESGGPIFLITHADTSANATPGAVASVPFLVILAATALGIVAEAVGFLQGLKSAPTEVSLGLTAWIIICIARLFHIIPPAFEAMFYPSRYRALLLLLAANIVGALLALQLGWSRPVWMH